MPFPDGWRLLPLEGAEPVRFGMTYEQVVGIVGEPDQALTRQWKSESRRAGWQGGTLSIHFNPGVVFIEFSRAPGLVVNLCGVDVFRTPAVDVVQALVTGGYPFDAEDPELGHSYVFRDLEAAVWRQVVPADEADERGRYFDTVGIGEPGYYA